MLDHPHCELNGNGLDHVIIRAKIYMKLKTYSRQYPLKSFKSGAKRTGAVSISEEVSKYLDDINANTSGMGDKY